MGLVGRSSSNSRGSGSHSNIRGDSRVVVVAVLLQPLAAVTGVRIAARLTTAFCQHHRNISSRSRCSCCRSAVLSFVFLLLMSSCSCTCSRSRSSSSSNKIGRC